MIVRSRTLTCNFCGQWLAVDDLESAREARRRARVYGGWRSYPDAGDRRKTVDTCPNCVKETS